MSEETLKCMVCKKAVPREEDPFEQFVATNETICRDCKKRLEDEMKQSRERIKNLSPEDRAVRDKLIDNLVADVGEYKKVLDVVSGHTYKVPTRYIADNGLKQEELSKFPLWEGEGDDKLVCFKCGYCPDTDPAPKKRKMIFLFGRENTEAVVCGECNK